MELNANVTYGNGTACFKVRRENPGIYCADLFYFDGNIKAAPPPRINLVRGIRQWTGSCDDADLMNRIGRRIEEEFATMIEVNRK